MDLSPYLETVRTGVANAASLADENTQQVAYRLGTAIESTTRLALIQVLSDAAGTLSAELAPTSVELRMAGQDPEFVVNVAASGAEPTLLLPEAESSTEQGAVDDDSEEPVARISLRLPASVKARIDEQASRDGISTNAWLVRAVLDALADRREAPGHRPGPPPPPPHPGGVFGPEGPFGPHGVFGEHGPFGPGGVFGGKTHVSHRVEHQGHGHGSAGGSVQGWAQ